MDNLVQKCIESIIRLDKSFNPDCEDENVVSAALEHLGIGILAGVYDSYTKGYMSNKDISDKTEYTEEEKKKFNELAHLGFYEIIEMDKKLYPNTTDSEPVVSIDALAVPLTHILDVAYKLGRDVQK